MTTDAQEPNFDDELQGQQAPENEVNSDSSPDSGENHEDKHNGFQQRINKVTADKYAEKRRADALQKELEELKKSSPTSEPVTTPTPQSTARPELPDDIYDEKKMRKYHNDMIAYNERIAQEASQKAAGNWEQQQKAEAQKQQQSQILQSWQQNAIKDGVDFDKLHAAEQVVNQAGISEQLATHIMRDANGPKIATYLADNPALLYEVISMNPTDAAVKIATEVKPQALSTTPKVSSAPEPIAEINGGGYVDKDEFDRKYPDTEFI